MSDRGRLDGEQIAMFPLGTVLLPTEMLPLQVFEPRYRTMMRDLVDGTRRFGVVLIERGFEVGGGDSKEADAATIARIEHEVENDDGTWQLLAAGDRRVHVDRWLDDDPYPRAVVSEWPDEAAADTSALAAHAGELGDRLRRIYEHVRARQPEVALPVLETGAAPPEASVQVLASATPAGAFDRQRLLTAAGPDQRCDIIEELCEHAELVLERDLGGD